MSRKRNSDDSVISVVDKNADMMADDGYFDAAGLETDNISNIISNHGVSTLDANLSGGLFEKEEDDDDSQGVDITPPPGISLYLPFFFPLFLCFFFFYFSFTLLFLCLYII